VAQLDIYNGEGTAVGKVELNADVFEVEPYEPHLHMAVVKQLANKRCGCASTKTRGEVRGGGKKPWKQKGTGRARHGSRRSPIWKGGGITFGPKPRDYSKKMNKKMRSLVLREALSAKLAENQMMVVESFDFETPNTKDFVGLMNNLKLSGKSLFVIKVADKPEEPIAFAENEDVKEYEKAMEEYNKSLDAFNKVCKSGRNIEGVRVVRPEGINVYDLLAYDNVIFDKAALEHVEEVLS
jgi:large subunit ribosomal protein L4